MDTLESAITPQHFIRVLGANGNSKCADCSALDPDWASLGFGTVICLNCAGHHRSLGTHITLVKSIKLDSWTPEQTSRLEVAGNERFSDYIRSLATVTGATDRVRKYFVPEVLYYREILDAQIEQRPPEPFEASQWTAQVTQSSHSPSPTSRTHPSWMPDLATTRCVICSAAFTLVLRRHHCRRCGKLVCHNCAPRNNSRPIMEWGLRDPVRHCRDCFKSPSLAWRDISHSPFCDSPAADPNSATRRSPN